jgi:hypothetical protein
MLKSNLEFWEVRARDEEAQRVRTWESEKQKIEAEIESAAGARDVLEQESAAALLEKNRALNVLHETSVAEEAAQQAAWKTEEARLVEERENLTREIAQWEKKIKDETSAIETERRAADKELERLKFESALKDTSLLGQKQKAERKWKKMQQDLLVKLTDIRRAMDEQREEWAQRIEAKDNEISTLKTRVTLRNERQKNELRRRQDEIKKVLFELETEIDLLKSKYEKNVPVKTSDLELRKKELSELTAAIQEKEEAWQRKQNITGSSLDATQERLSGELAVISRELIAERERLEQLFSAKDAYIRTLHEQLSAKDDGLSQEREHTLALLGTLRQKTAEFRKSLRQQQPAADGGAGTAKILDEALTQYHAGSYESAVRNLEGLIKTHPQFAGAYQYLALCYWHLGKSDASKKMAERALELEPHNESLKSWIASIGNK